MPPAGSRDGLERFDTAIGRPRRVWHESAIAPTQRRLAWVVVLLLHGLFALAVWIAMRPVAPPPSPTAPEEMLQVRLIDAAPVAPAPPPPPIALPPAPASPPVPKHPEPPAKNAMVLQTPAAPAPRLFDEHGQPLLPATSSTAPLPAYVQRMPQGNTRIMQHDSPVKYQPTRFEQDWGGGNAVDDALQKLVDKTTVKKTIRLPGGIRLHCGVSLAMLAGGCGGDPPPPPSRKDGDERLNMAPATSLDGHAHAQKPPSLESCIAMYRAGKPLAYGCPVDTPDRAVDAELRERAGQRRGDH
ncbi:MAG: hypothetical protein ABI178_13720 [Rhodanobacter sp.]